MILIMILIIFKKTNYGEFSIIKNQKVTFGFFYVDKFGLI